MKTFILILILSLSFLNGQEENSLTNPFPDGNFIPLPLKVSNAWTYRQKFGGKTSYHSLWIADLININSQWVYILNDDWLFDNNGAYYKDGILYGMGVSYPEFPVEIVIPKDPVPGQTWIVDVDRVFKLEAIDDAISVPAGTFSAYKISVTRQPSVYNIWWANGIGIVKISGGEENSELISFFTE